MSKRKLAALAILLSSYLDDEDESDDSTEKESDEEREQLDEEKQLETTTKRARKTSDEEHDHDSTSLPLPEGILNMFNDRDISKTSGDCDGRTRSFEHFPGNWALHVYAAFPGANAIDHIIDSLVNSLPTTTSMHRFPLGELHVSVSRTVPIRHYWIDPITEQLKDALALKQRFTCIVENPQLYVNDDKTRSFLGLKISTGEEQLQSLTSLVDTIFDGFALPKFYENPSFHVSVAWCLGDIFDQITKDDEEKLQAAFDSAMTDKSSKLLHFEVKEIKCKIGNKLFSFSL